MFKFIFAMIIPVIIFIYTLSFTRLLSSKKHVAAAASTATLALISLFISGAVLWKLLT